MRAHLSLVTTFLVVVAGCTPESPATETSVTASSDTSWSDNSPRFSPDGSKLVFSSDRYGHDDIFTIPVEGGQPARITDDPGLDLDPSFLPDGRILFDSDRDGSVGLYVMNADGTQVTALPGRASAGAIFPAASPDGGTVAFACGPSFEGLDLCLIDVDGSNFRTIAPTPDAQEWEVTWSPDGAHIAFASDRAGNFDIYVIGSDGAGLVQLTSGTGREADPAWSPDGAEIAFDAELDGGSVIETMRTDGSNARLLFDPKDIHAVQPAWSPDGRLVAFYSTSPSDRIFVYDVQRRTFRQLTT